ncbi:MULTISPECIES: hypothetical protein [Nostoc]|uniref:Uncharacterized protein n=2 Tax=Nostoc TaxID=1177 RepID=A0ABR8IAA6_9NOSO|nr:MULTISPECIES: hypothetical protein [Nostoc]MBD2562664.1 hypothetical protein [Nostoc linckia FACHB-391]MBD2647702.1 hypothetical protein [Nostoc foliaceum FACHB-393]
MPQRKLGNAPSALYDTPRVEKLSPEAEARLFAESPTPKHFDALAQCL